MRGVYCMYVAAYHLIDIIIGRWSCLYYRGLYYYSRMAQGPCQPLQHPLSHRYCECATWLRPLQGSMGWLTNDETLSLYTDTHTYLPLFLVSVTVFCMNVFTPENVSGCMYAEHDFHNYIYWL